MIRLPPLFFFFNDTATTEIYTLSLHDALPISFSAGAPASNVFSLQLFFLFAASPFMFLAALVEEHKDRKSTRLNSSHGYISYAVFCLKKKSFTSSFTLSCKNCRTYSHASVTCT